MEVPPFRYTDTIVNLIAEITQKLASCKSADNSESNLRLRKVNRIKTIHSSLAIEGNRLSEGQVRDIINGKAVIAPMREVQEVKNAIATYNMYDSLNPFDMKDLLRAHSTMMMALADDAGHFRRGGVGVFGENGPVHIAPSAPMVPMLMSNLFEWLTKSDAHLLIRSCVFHYEFEFIHPFSDGNGRMGRLWQSLILGQLHPIFHDLPVENLVYANQQAYYDAIAKSSAEGGSTPFIEFMLSEILNAINAHQSERRGSLVRYVPIKKPGKFPNNIPNIIPNNYQNAHPEISEIVWHVVSLINNIPGASAEAIGDALGISARMVRTHISKLRDLGLITRIGSNKTGYWKVNRPSEEGEYEA